MWMYSLCEGQDFNLRSHPTPFTYSNSHATHTTHSLPLPLFLLKNRPLLSMSKEFGTHTKPHTHTSTTLLTLEEKLPNESSFPICSYIALTSFDCTPPLTSLPPHLWKDGLGMLSLEEIPLQYPSGPLCVCLTQCACAHTHTCTPTQGHTCTPPAIYRQPYIERRDRSLQVFQLPVSLLTSSLLSHHLTGRKKGWYFWG